MSSDPKAAPPRPDPLDRFVDDESGRGPYRAVTAIVLLLGGALLALMWSYWAVVVEPRLRAEAVSQAEILARSQSILIAQALRQGEGAERVRSVVQTLDELLLLREPTSQTAFFANVELQVDYDTVPAEEGSLDLVRGDRSSTGFRSEIAIYDPRTDELLAVAWLEVSDRFYRQLAGDLRRGLFGVVVGGLALLALFWGALVVALRTLQRQRAERFRAERELLAQERKYQRLVDNLSSYFVYGRDAAGRLAFVSDSVRRVLRMSPREALRHLDSELPEAAADGNERVYGLEIVDAEGTTRHLELSELGVGGADGPAGFDGIARDVTAQRQFEEELRYAKEMAESANRAKSQFLANMSHEIRTPLNAIVGMTALSLKADLPPRVRDYLDKLRAAARLLTELIEDILDLSRIEAGRLELQRIDFDLDDLLADLADVIGVRAGERRLEILLNAEPDVPRRLRGDPVRLKQVLLNLLGNALKFTERGEVVVGISVAESRRERVELRFTVRDTGVGIPAEQVERLFEPFTQVDASMTRRFGGLGLGLAISRRLVEMMGGELEVESREGAGSTFGFVAAFDLPRGAAGPRRLADEFHDLPVLVADDNASARAVFSTMLSSLTCRVTTVASGEEAIAAARRATDDGHPFRLALLDWRMPGLDGAETARWLRGEVALPSILVTAYDREDAARRAAEAGVEVVLHKPVSPSTLHDALLRVLDPHRNGDERGDRPAPALRRFASGQRVLVAEDNAINREVAREFLVAAGLSVSEAHNGLEVLARLDGGERFDAVLLDVQMPELDGVETVRRLRREERWRELPVVAMTAHAMLGDRERFLAAGMSDYVAKPIEETVLLEVLGRWLRTDERPTATAGSTAEAPAVPARDEALPGLAVDSGLRSASGNEALFRRLVRDFATESRDAPEALEAELRAGDRAAALARLHTLKGAAATVGAARVAAEAARLERSLRDATADDPSLVELSRALAELGESAAALPGEDVAKSAESATTPTPETATGLLARLEELLPRHDLAALDCFAELSRAVGDRGGETLERLGRALEELDFEAAGAHLRRLGQALGLPEPGT